MEKEIWKIYKTTYAPRWGHRTYEVSNMGRVKINGIIVQPGFHNEYYAIGCFKVHHAVAQLFIPNPENKPCIDHINTNKLDNRASNLRWVTYSENMLNPITRKQNSEIQRGKKHSKEHNEKISQGLLRYYRKGGN